MHIDSVIGPDLVKTLTKVNPSSSGLDAWKPESLVVLGRCFRSIFDGLAILLKWVEERSHWPASLLWEFDTSQEQ